MHLPTTALWFVAVAIGFGVAACAAKTTQGGAGSGANSAGTGGVGGSSGSGGSSGVAGVAATGGFGGVAATGGFGGVAATGGVGGSAGDDCGGVTARAEAELLPTDVIWAIDTSGSMTASFPAIQQALAAFSQRIVAANIDAHIILLAGAGGGLGNQGLCVPAPLGSGNCGAAALPGGSAADSREPTFLHLDLPFGSTEGMATLLDNHSRYRHLLRANARTQLVLTEDGVPPMTPVAVTDHIEGRAAATGTAAWNPGLIPGNYQWNGIVCSTGGGTGTCVFAFFVPQTTLTLVAQTQGLLGNLDDAGKMGVPDPFASLLDRLAEQVIVGARVSCDYVIPEPPAGEIFDRERVNVVYRSGDQEQVFPRAAENVPCMDALGWKYDNELSPTRVVLCPAACTLAQNDANAEINVSFDCETVLLMPD